MNPRGQAPLAPTENAPPLRRWIAEANAADRDLVVLELARAGIRGTQTHVTHEFRHRRAASVMQVCDGRRAATGENAEVPPGAVPKLVA
jgi:hypothetical protein